MSCKHCKKANFFLSVNFFSFVFVSWKQKEKKLDPDSNPELITDPDPNLQIITDPDPDAQHCLHDSRVC
jgi:hypothetical protein